MSGEQAQRINEGVDFFFFRNTDNIQEPEKVKLYKAYEVLFRLMPSIPKWLKIRLKPKHVLWMPDILVRPLSTLSDIVTGFAYGNPEFRAYAKHNLFHLFGFFTFRIKRLKATKIKDKQAQPELIAVEDKLPQTEMHQEKVA